MARRGPTDIGFGLATGEGRWRDLGKLTSGLAAAFAAVLLSCAGTRADDGFSTNDFAARWGAWGEVGATYGTGQSSYGEIGIFAPLWQSPDSLFFANIHGKYFETDLIEGNFALGGRHMLPSGWNLGAWGALDVRRTASDNVFGQISGGLEALSEHFDLRLNGYLPFTGPQAAGPGMADVILDGGNIFMVGGREVPLAGVDAEIGARVPFAGNAGHVGVYGGGFWFGHEDAVEATGGKARVELAFNDVAGAGSRFSAQYEFVSDTVRGGRHLVGARLRIPLGASPPASEVPGQWLRMADRIERDVDIIIGQSSAEQVINEYNNQLVTSAVVVDVGAGADQAALQGEINGGGDGRVIILDGALENLTTTTALAARKTLIGGDTDLAVRGAKSGTAGVFNAGLGPGTISGAVPGDIHTFSDAWVVGLAPDSVLGGLTVANTSDFLSHGVFGAGAHGATVFGNRVSTKGASSNGIYFFDSAEGTALGNTVTTEGAFADGIFFHDSDGGKASGNRIRTGGDDAYGIYFLRSADGTASGNRIKTEGTEAHGIGFEDSAGGIASGNKVATEGANASGIVFAHSADGTASGNRIETAGSRAFGIFFDVSDDSTASSNWIRTEGQDAEGIFFGSDGGTASDNRIRTEGNDADGIFFNGSAGGTASGNSIQTEGNRAAGIHFLNFSNGIASGNRIKTEGDDAEGILFSNAAGSTASDNRIKTEGGGAIGIFFSNGSNGGTAAGNTITTKGVIARGIFFSGSAGSTASGNRIRTGGAAAGGIYFLNSADGTASGNRVSTAGDDAFGILFELADDGTASGNRIKTKGDGAYGIWFSISHDGRVLGNKVATGGDGAYGILLEIVDDGTVSGNRIKTEGIEAHGISVVASDNLTTAGNRIATAGADAHGVHTSRSEDLTITGNIFGPTIGGNLIFAAGNEFNQTSFTGNSTGNIDNTVPPADRCGLLASPNNFVSGTVFFTAGGNCVYVPPP